MDMYFLALVLPDALNEEIQKLKVMMHEKFGCSVGLKSPAHITVIPPFWMEQNREAELIHDAEKTAALTTPFIIGTHNFSTFKNRTIFIDVLHNDQLDAFKQKADDVFTENRKYKLKKENRPFHPHITIATRDIPRQAFYEAWSFFEHKEYDAEWLATTFSLLHHNKKTWDVIYTAPFKREER